MSSDRELRDLIRSTMYPMGEAKSDADLRAIDANGYPLYAPPGYFGWERQQTSPDARPDDAG